ncbi:MAG TPA: AsnC family transcriptional regulator [Candidatus Brocadiia bacterium]|nr:AsnC family transcriptional regulator [Candidatus Brocadiia bacterium]
MTADELDLKIIDALQGGLPVAERPYAIIADRIGISEFDVIERVRAMLADGRMRRFAAVANHNELGFKNNALIVWSVSDEQIEQAGERIAAFPQVTHCYARSIAPDWPYNLYAMVHARSELEFDEILAALDAAAGTSNRVALRTEREFKKTSVPVRDIMSGNGQNGR